MKRPKFEFPANIFSPWFHVLLLLLLKSKTVLLSLYKIKNPKNKSQKSKSPILLYFQKLPWRKILGQKTGLVNRQIFIPRYYLQHQWASKLDYCPPPRYLVGSNDASSAPPSPIWSETVTFLKQINMKVVPHQPKMHKDRFLLTLTSILLQFPKVYPPWES